MYSLLLIDDDPAREAIERLVAPAGFSVTVCKSGTEFDRELDAAGNKHHVALIDYRLGSRFSPKYENGIAVTKALLDRYHEVGVVGYSAFLDAKFEPQWDDTVAKWLVAGARWFCDKTKLIAGRGFEVTLQVLLQSAAMAEEWKRLRRQAGGLDLAEFKGLSGTLDTLDRIAHLPSPVLILGETGTGKELLAKRLHQMSGRTGPFVVGNCANLRGELAEVMMHGQEVHQNDPRAAGYPKPGWFEQADEGTLFLDEVGDLPIDAQASLLRVLQEHEVRRVLGADWVNVNFRLVAATNHNLEADTTAGIFRKDLYFRLATFPLLVPPLSERKGDIPLLVNHFVAKYGTLFGRSVELAPAVIDYLIQRRYPGNIRELENVVQRFIALCTNSVLDVDEAKQLDHLRLTDLSSMKQQVVSSQREYAELISDWIAARLSDFGVTHELRTRTALLRSAVNHVCAGHLVPGDYPKSEQYVLRELIQKHRPDVYERILKADSERTRTRRKNA